MCLLVFSYLFLFLCALPFQFISWTLFQKFYELRQRRITEYKKMKKIWSRNKRDERIILTKMSMAICLLTNAMNNTITIVHTCTSAQHKPNRTFTQTHTHHHKWHCRAILLKGSKESEAHTHWHKMSLPLLVISHILLDFLDGSSSSSASLARLPACHAWCTSVYWYENWLSFCSHQHFGYFLNYMFYLDSWWYRGIHDRALHKRCNACMSMVEHNRWYLLLFLGLRVLLLLSSLSLLSLTAILLF